MVTRAVVSRCGGQPDGAPDRTGSRTPERQAAPLCERSSAGTLAVQMLSIAEVADELTGRVRGPDDQEYDRARTVFYGEIDRRPA